MSSNLQSSKIEHLAFHRTRGLSASLRWACAVNYYDVFSLSLRAIRGCVNGSTTGRAQQFCCLSLLTDLKSSSFLWLIDYFFQAHAVRSVGDQIKLCHNSYRFLRAVSFYALEDRLCFQRLRWPESGLLSPNSNIATTIIA